MLVPYFYSFIYENFRRYSTSK